MSQMKATARRTGTYRHMVDIRSHHVSADEPLDAGGDDTAPSPQELLAASLASCTAITMEMYARRKGWDLGATEVECEYQPAERGTPTRFALVLRLPDALPAEQARALVESGAYDLAFLLRPTPVDQVRAVAAAGATMPPKSTYFFPKVPTGLLFNALHEG